MLILSYLTCVQRSRKVWQTEQNNITCVDHIVGHDAHGGLFVVVAYDDMMMLCSCRSGQEEKLMALLTPLNVNCHASDGRKVRSSASILPWEETFTLSPTN